MVSGKDDRFCDALKFQNDYGAPSPTTSELNAIIYPLTPWVRRQWWRGVKTLAADRNLAFNNLKTTLVKDPGAPHGMTWGNESFLESHAHFSWMQER